MYSTFIGFPAQQGSQAGSPIAGSAPPKRDQVARACEWCRAHRIKCDSGDPCQTCRRRGGKCTKNRNSQLRTLPQALREIERLQGKIRELEHRIHNPLNAESANSLSTSSQIVNRVCSSQRTLGGIQIRTTLSHQTQWYGPSSAFYFIGRMSSYLRKEFGQHALEHNLQPNSARHVFTSPTSPKKAEGPEMQYSLSDVHDAKNFLEGLQEEYFLQLFWPSLQSIVQIVDEADFREHYRSLWVDSATTRKPSALVDIVIALCMQYGMALEPNNNNNSTSWTLDSDDASIAGRWYYRRAQMLLTSDMESPSITTLQCYIFSVCYLCNASFQNMAHTTLAVAVRTAHILGLHLEPPESLPRAQRELRKRLWWTVYCLEVNTCMKLGRPFSMSDAIACQLPADDRELALISSSNFAFYGSDTTWLTYSRWFTKLFQTVQSIYLAFWDNWADSVGADDANTGYKDPYSLDRCAECLSSQMSHLRQWVDGVPDTLKTKRTDGGKPLSTDLTAFDMERFAPLWLQRQRLFLELLYHNLSMNLYRPFIMFPLSTSSSSSSTPRHEAHAISCVQHAMSIANILRQVLTTTNTLSGWYEAFQWQWNAILSMVGFSLAYPTHTLTTSARSTIHNSLAVLGSFGNFAVASSAVTATQDLLAKVDYLINWHATPPSNALVSPEEATNLAQERNRGDGESEHLGPIDAYLGGSSPSHDVPFAFQNSLAHALGLSLFEDSLYSFEPLYASSEYLGDSWDFT